MKKTRSTQRYHHDVVDWLETASRDLKWGKDNFKLGYFAQVCFIAQQIVEKTLKAYLLSRGVPVKKVHALPLLLKDCQKHLSQFDQFIEACSLLNGYYTETRYPSFGPSGEYSKKEAKEALEFAQEIFNFVQKKTKGHSR